MARPKNLKKFERLYALGESKMRRITEEMAKPHASPALCAKMIQEEWGDYLDVSHAALSQQLNRYRQAMLDNDLPKPVSVGKLRAKMLHPDIKPTTIGEEDISGLTPQRTNPLNVLEEMAWLATQQKQRIEDALVREREMKMPISHVDSMIKNLRETLIEAQKVRFELGMDTYMMPVAGKGTMTVTVVTPEGTLVNMQMTEAVQEAATVLGHLIENGHFQRVDDDVE